MTKKIFEIPADNQKLSVGIGWNEKRSDGADHDVDCSVLLISADGQCHEPQDLCFYKKEHQNVHNGAVIHYGDEKVGATIGDDEFIDINLDRVPERIEKLLVCVTIHQAKARRLNFGLIDSAYVRILDQNEHELAAYDLSEDASLATGIEYCEIVRKGKGWECHVVAKTTTEGFAGIISRYGFNPK